MAVYNAVVFLTCLVSFEISEIQAQCPYPCICQRNTSDTVVVCENQNLYTFPDFSVLEGDHRDVSVFFSGNTFSHVLRSRMWHLRDKLRELEITGNTKVINVSPDAFDYFQSSLQSLRIEPILRASIQRYNNSMFASLLKIRKLYLSCRNERNHSNIDISTIPRSLKILHITHCGISSIQTSQNWEDSFLIELSLIGNQLIAFPDHISFMLGVTLQKLYLSNNNIPALKKGDIPEGCKLKVLWLNQNKIQVIEEETLEHCLTLKELNLSENKYLLKLSPVSFQSLSGIRLDVSLTGISSLDFVEGWQVINLRAGKVQTPCSCEPVNKFRHKLEGQCWEESLGSFLDFKVVRTVCSIATSTSPGTHFGHVVRNSFSRIINDERAHKYKHHQYRDQPYTKVSNPGLQEMSSSNYHLNRFPISGQEETRTRTDKDFLSTQQCLAADDVRNGLSIELPPDDTDTAPTSWPLVYFLASLGYWLLQVLVIVQFQRKQKKR